MSHKTITRNCPSCKKLVVNDQGNFQCMWGRSKKRKIIYEVKRTLRYCKLNLEKEFESCHT
jgi:hypothetical protein